MILTRICRNEKHNIETSPGLWPQLWAGAEPERHRDDRGCARSRSAAPLRSEQPTWNMQVLVPFLCLCGSSAALLSRRAVALGVMTPLISAQPVPALSPVREGMAAFSAVSYTHLTLPTKA